MDIIAYLLMIIYSLDILALFFFGLHAYLMVFLYRKNKQYCVSGNDYPPLNLKTTKAAKIPVVTVQLPIFNEFYVCDRLIDATTKLNWPKSKLEIQVLDDSTDETVDKVASIVAEYKRQGFLIEHIHRTNRKGHKAGALREALEVAKGDLIAIFDADFIPDPDFLVKSIPYFQDKEIGMVQTRWGHINEDFSVLTRAQSFGIDGHFMIEQVARNANQLWMNFNGTGGIWRRQCIYDAGNWQSDTLTEDFDLSYRAELAGWKFRYLMDVVNPAELPATISSFKSQQFRWCKGSIQTAVKLIPRIMRADLHWKIKAEALTHLLNYSVHPLMIINIIFALPLLTMDYWSSLSVYDVSVGVMFGAAAFLSISTLGPTVFYMYSQKELHKNWKRRGFWMPVLTIIGTGIAVNNTKAFIEAILGVSSTFKRTPKYRIESKADKIQDRKKYKLPLDPMAILEIAFGIYCLLTIYYSVVFFRLFLIPFMILYALGFFYIAFSSIKESMETASLFGFRKQAAAETEEANEVVA